MSDRMHTLKEINLDAARYRWVRENIKALVVSPFSVLRFDNPEQMDNYISRVLENEP